jgi:hypothetical protein
MIKKHSPVKQMSATKKEEQRNKLLKEKSQKIFFGFIVFVILVLAPFTYETSKALKIFWKNIPDGYRWP